LGRTRRSRPLLRGLYDPELCSEEHYCQELVLLDEEHDAGEAGRKEHDR
jgi:hypothetical protein